MKEKELINKYKELVCNKDTDPEEEYVWEGIFVGFAIANNFTATEARNIFNNNSLWLLEDF